MVFELLSENVKLLGKDAQKEISDILIELSKQGNPVSFLDGFKMRDDPIEIFPEHISTKIRRNLGNDSPSPSDLLSYFGKHLLIYSNLSIHRIYL
jgi:hypothetical protein